MSVIGSLDIITNSQKVANNTSSITVKGYCQTTNGEWRGDHRTGTYTIKQGSKVLKSGSFTHGASANKTTTLFSVTLTVTHNSDGTSGTITASFNYDSGFCQGTQSNTLKTINRKSTIMSRTSSILGTEQTFTLSVPASSFKHKITYECGSATGYVAGSSSTFVTGTSVKWTPPLSLASQNTSGTSVSMKIYVKTYTSSGTQTGTVTYTITYSIPSSVAPSCSLSVTDALGYVDTYGGYIKGLSKFKVVVTPTTAYGSAIASYSTKANGSTYTSASFTTDSVKTVGSNSVVATVKDKRGRSGSDDVMRLIVFDYALPNISKCKVGRCNADGTSNDQGDNCKVTFSGTITKLQSDYTVKKQNTPSFKVYAKKTSESEDDYVEISSVTSTFSVTDKEVIFAADSGSSYNIKLVATDDFGSATYVTNLSTGFTIIHWLASGLGMALGKIAELVGVLDIGFKTRFMGGILHPVLPAETDLNEVLTPNTYVGANLSTYNYTCGGGSLPLDTGTFTLEVVGMGEEGQVKQRLTYCHKTASRAWERIYYQEAWGDWICVSDFDGQLLWSGGYYMSAEHTIALAEAISKQKNGIVLVFSQYSDSTAQNWGFNHFFVHKKFVADHAGHGSTFIMAANGFGAVASKYLYISDEKIVGHDNNVATGTAHGIEYTNNVFVLRYVIGV